MTYRGGRRGGANGAMAPPKRPEAGANISFGPPKHQAGPSETRRALWARQVERTHLTILAHNMIHLRHKQTLIRPEKGPQGAQKGPLKRWGAFLAPRGPFQVLRGPFHTHKRTSYALRGPSKDWKGLFKRPGAFSSTHGGVVNIVVKGTCQPWNIRFSAFEPRSRISSFQFWCLKCLKTHRYRSYSRKN